MNLIRSTTLATILLAAACQRAPGGASGSDGGGEVAALRSRVLESSEAATTVVDLTDRVGPRLSGSPGYTAAIAWGLAAMEKAGLTSVHAEACKVPHWERGEERGEVLAPAPQPLVLTALGGSVATPPEGLEAEVVEAPSIEALDAMPPDALAGKIALVYVRMVRARDGAGYEAAATPRGKGAIHAAKKGAVGLLIRSAGTDDLRAPHTGAMRYEDGVPKIPAAALASPDADSLHRLIASGQRVRVRLHIDARTLPDADGANVVGDVVGTDPGAGVVLVGAHLDSWDLGRGALDDGAGCAIALEVGRQVARTPKKPRRTIRVVLFANEENGLRGATAYAAAHAAELDRHVLGMEADLGTGKVYEARFLGPDAARPAFEALAATLAPLGVTASNGKSRHGADVIPLVEAGVPALSLLQDATTYFDFHHSANDTAEHVDKPAIDQAAAAFAAAAYAAADAAGDFGRVPPEKRKEH